VRKEETSWASEGLKGVVWKESVVVSEDEVLELVEDDLRPVSLSQIDILKRVGEAEGGRSGLFALALVEIEVNDVQLLKKFKHRMWPVRFPHMTKREKANF
jgi:hypothetical protein